MNPHRGRRLDIAWSLRSYRRRIQTQERLLAIEIAADDLGPYAQSNNRRHSPLHEALSGSEEKEGWEAYCLTWSNLR